VSPPSLTNRQSRQTVSKRLGKAQLSLVEHALCPLDAKLTLQPSFLFETAYFFTDKNRNRKKAKAKVGALDGMSPHDELYLWGLLSLVFSQPKASADFFATPYYCLRNLGLISADKKGGREFQLFRAAIKRLAGIRYQNDRFYDPIRGEHRDVSFGFLNYSLPLDPKSSRSWRFAWDPIFFELCQATGGALSFDLDLYRQLDPAARRLYLFLKKVFWRRDVSPALELRHLAIDVLGFAPTMSLKQLKWKLLRVISELLDSRLLRLPDEFTDLKALIERHAKGVFRVRLYRGDAFNQTTSMTSYDIFDSPLYDPLHSIGFDDRMIARLIDRYSLTLLEQWADITLAALERKGQKFFTESPQAYFMDSLKAAAARKRTPPDWWRELRRREREMERNQEEQKQHVFSDESDEVFEQYIQNQARDVFQSVMKKLVSDLRSAGQSEPEARTNAEHMARMHLRNRFRKEHPEFTGS